MSRPIKEGMMKRFFPRAVLAAALAAAALAHSASAETVLKFASFVQPQ